MVTHFPALEATSFIPECASGSDLRKCRRSLPMGREPQPSLKSGDIYRVASGRDSDAARLGTKSPDSWTSLVIGLLLVRLRTVVKSRTGRRDMSGVPSPPGPLP